MINIDDLVYRINSIISELDKEGIRTTPTNIITRSLFSVGGTIDKKDIRTYLNRKI